MNKSDFIEQLKTRTKRLAIAIILFYENLEKTESIRIIGKQLIRSITSVAANYRAACLARSQREFFSKMSIVVEEADESLFWLEVYKDSKLVSSNELSTFIDEITEILKIVSKARKTASKN